MKQIQIDIKPDGTISIETKGYVGADCEKATQFLEEALGETVDRERKPEYYMKETNRQQHEHETE